MVMPLAYCWLPVSTQLPPPTVRFSTLTAPAKAPLPIRLTVSLPAPPSTRPTMREPVQEVQRVVAAAQVQGQAVAAFDQAGVGHGIGLAADDPDGETRHAAYRAFVDQRGRVGRRAFGAVVDEDAVGLAADDGLRRQVADSAAARGDAFAVVGRAVFLALGPDALDGAVVR